MAAVSVPYIHELLSVEAVHVGLPGVTKMAVIEALLAGLASHPAVRDAEAMRQAVLEREEVMSTGVGKGVGLPHAKTSAVRGTLAAFAVTAKPIDFGALDDQPVRLLFLLIGPEGATSEHIKILSRVSRLLNRAGLRERLLAAKKPRQILDAFEEAELHLTDG